MWPRMQWSLSYRLPCIRVQAYITTAEGLRISMIRVLWQKPEIRWERRPNPFKVENNTNCTIPQEKLRRMATSKLTEKRLPVQGRQYLIKLLFSQPWQSMWILCGGLYNHTCPPLSNKKADKILSQQISRQSSRCLCPCIQQMSIIPRGHYFRWLINSCRMISNRSDHRRPEKRL